MVVCFAVGFNQFGQLGEGDCIVNTPRQIITDNIIEHATWESTSWRSVDRCSLHGLGSTETIPRSLKSPEPFRKARFVSKYGCVVLDDSGTVWKCSADVKPVTIAQHCRDFDVFFNHIVLLTEAGEILEFELQSSNFAPKTITAPEPLSKICCGSQHSIGLTSDGAVYTWGSASFGQLGHGDVHSCRIPTLVSGLEDVRVVSAAAGFWHSLFLTDDGDVYAAGWDQEGQLGLGDSSLRINRALPNLVELPDDISPITAVACGVAHSVALSSSGIFSWGWGKYGQLGHGTCTNETIPRRIAGFPSSLLPTHVCCGPWSTIVQQL